MGSGYRTFASGEILTAANVMNYLQDQAVMVFAGTAARASAIGTANYETGMVTYRTDGTADAKRQGFEFYDGSAWTKLLVQPGYTPVSTVEMTSASATHQFANVFSSSYRNYRVLLEVTGSTGANFYIRLLVGTTAQTGNILSIQRLVQLSTATQTISTRSDQYGLIGAIFATYPSTYIIDFFAPQVATYTDYQSSGTGARSNTDSDAYNISARNIATTQIDGFEITTATATTITGRMTVYGATVI